MDIYYYTPVIGLSYIVKLIINNNITYYYCTLCNVDIKNEKEIRLHCIKTDHNNDVFKKNYSSINNFLLKNNKINDDVVYKLSIIKNIYNIINREEERIKLYYIVYKYTFKNNNYDINNLKKSIVKNIYTYNHLNEINWIDSYNILLHDIKSHINYYNINKNLQSGDNINNIINQINNNQINNNNKYKHYKIIHNNISDPRNSNYLLNLSNKNKKLKLINKTHFNKNFILNSNNKFKDYNTYIKEKYNNILN